MLKQIFLVGIGGGFGSILRFLSSVLTTRYYTGVFPLATFLVNISGCFLIGMLVGLMSAYFPLNNNLRLLLVTGFCGGYTTFSAFAVENLNLLQCNNLFIMCAYLAASIILGIGLVWLGIILGSSL